jgi:drug/metabolite transporter (DMT)-like permease
VAGITLLVLARVWRSAAGETSRRAPNESSWLPRRHELVLGVIYGSTLLTYVLAQTFTTTANAIFLQYTAPIYILIFSAWLLGERPKLGDFLTLPALLAGVLLILSAQLRFSQGGFGNVMGLLSGVCYALLIMLMRKWRDAGALRGIAWGNFLLAGAGIGLALLSPQGFVRPDVRAGAQILWLGVAQIGIAYFLFQACLRHITAIEASLLALLEPVLCPVWAWIFVGDNPPLLSLAGGGVIIAALVAHTAWKTRAESSPPAAA